MRVIIEPDHSYIIWYGKAQLFYCFQTAYGQVVCGKQHSVYLRIFLQKAFYFLCNFFLVWLQIECDHFQVWRKPVFVYSMVIAIQPVAHLRLRRMNGHKTDVLIIMFYKMPHGLVNAIKIVHHNIAGGQTGEISIEEHHGQSYRPSMPVSHLPNPGGGTII